MIARYQRPAMMAVWSEKNRLDTYLRIEVLNVEALAAQNVVEARDLELIRNHASYDIDRVRELEAKTKHDVVAFTRAVEESLGEERRFIHYGLTSTDVVDTANAVLLKQANAILLQDIDRFMAVLKSQALAHKHTLCVGRTHGMHAEPTMFGLKWALWHEDMARARRRFVAAAAEVECGKVSGAVGNYAFTDPKVETYICGRLGIAAATISTQTLQRDRHASYLATIALIGAELEKIATEIRHLQRTEVGEVAEAFGSGQTGSSAMPHKHNPISSENICGLARVLRGYVLPAFEDIALWHERDISHSSVERIVLPDATMLLDFMLDRYAGVLSALSIDTNRMVENIGLTRGTIFSQRVLGALLEAGCAREEAYEAVQRAAEAAIRNGTGLQVEAGTDKYIARHLDSARLAECFTTDYYSRHVDLLFDRVFAGGGRA